MGFFKDLREDISQAVNELLPDDEFLGLTDDMEEVDETQISNKDMGNKAEGEDLNSLDTFLDEVMGETTEEKQQDELDLEELHAIINGFDEDTATPELQQEETSNATIAALHEMQDGQYEVGPEASEERVEVKDTVAADADRSLMEELNSKPSMETEIEEPQKEESDVPDVDVLPEVEPEFEETQEEEKRTADTDVLPEVEPEFEEAQEEEKRTADTDVLPEVGSEFEETQEEEKRTADTDVLPEVQPEFEEAQREENMVPGVPEAVQEPEEEQAPENEQLPEGAVELPVQDIESPTADLQSMEAAEEMVTVSDVDVLPERETVAEEEKNLVSEAEIEEAMTEQLELPETEDTKLETTLAEPQNPLMQESDEKEETADAEETPVIMENGVPMYTLQNVETVENRAQEPNEVVAQEPESEPTEQPVTMDATNKEYTNTKIEKDEEAMENNFENTEVKNEVTVITKGTVINGSISSDGSLEVNGTITGDVECLGKLTINGNVSGHLKGSEVVVSTPKLDGGIDSQGDVKINVGTIVIGDVTATSATISGAVKGEIDVQGPVVVDSTAIVKGNINAKSVQINNGAVVDGYCKLTYADVDIDNFFDGE